MPRTSPIYYLPPSAISITPNANGQANDLAVYLARGATIKVHSQAFKELAPENGEYREWTLAGRNRRLANADTPYTIYARLRRNDPTDGYLVFAPQTLRDGVWVDKYSCVTQSGYSVLYRDGGMDVQVIDADYWYIRLGDVSLPENGQRTVTLDTGILGTEQYNEQWELNPNTLPLRVDVANSKTAGVPFVSWTESIEVTPKLVQGWDADASARVDHWTVVRDTGDTVSDAAWNHPGGDDHHVLTGSSITLTHARGTEDDFNAAPSAAFLFTAWGVEDPENSESSELVALATGSITILAETVEKYELALSTHLASYNPMTRQYHPTAGIDVRIRATAQDGSVFYLTNAQVATAQLVVLYAPAGASDDDAVELHFSGTATDEAVVNIPIRVFEAQQSLDVRLTNAAAVELDARSIAFVRDGEDSKEREWIYRLNSSAGYADTTANRGKQFQDDDFVPVGWTDDPVGVSAAGDTEYASWRDWDHGNGTWGAFATPVIWSHYGESITKSGPDTFRYATNSTGVRPAATSSLWQATRPTLQEGYWLYTETTLHWSDDTTSVLYTAERNPNDGVAGQAIVVDGATVILYYVGDSNTTHPAEDSAEWKPLSQVTQTQGRWLWSKATTYYRKADSAAGSHDAGSSVNYNVTYIARDGDTGAAGRGIVGITEYYKASANATGETAPDDDSGWTTDPNTAMQAWGSSAKYLWNYEKTEYSSGQRYERTAPQVLAIWTKDGAAGRGIDSVQNYYKTTNSTTPPLRTHEGGTGWDDDPMAPTAEAPYLWNYERITWINPAGTTYTAVQMIGHYGKNGKDGDTWAIGADGYWYKNGTKYTDASHPDGIIAEGKDGTGIELRGTVDVVLNSERTGQQTSLESVTGMDIGDCYMVSANGWLYFYDGTSPAAAATADTPASPAGWKPVGRIKGEPGSNSYMHIAYAEDITLVGGTVTAVTGFSVTRQRADYAWIGLRADHTEADPGADAQTDAEKLAAARQYDWNYVKGAPGTSPWVADLDNEMDSVACDVDGKPAAAQEVTTHPALFWGNAAQAFKITAVTRNGSATIGTGVTVKIDGTARTSTSTAALTHTVAVAYATTATIAAKDDYALTLTNADGTVTRTLHFTVNGVRPGAKGEDAVIYQLRPSRTAINVGRTAAGGYTPANVTLTCGYVKNAGGTFTTVADAVSQIDSRYNIYFRLRSRATHAWPAGFDRYGFQDNYTMLTSTGVNVATSDAVEFILCTNTADAIASEAAVTGLVDRETVPVVSDGEKGEDGGTPVSRYQWNQSASTAPTYNASAQNPGSNWKTTVPGRPADGYFLWTISAILNADGTYGSWGNPIRLTGDTGSPGEDGADMEYIYTRRSVATTFSGSTGTNALPANITTPDSSSTGQTAADDDFVPTGWKDGPQGVTETYKFEYMAWRRKPAGTDAVWGPFSAPVLWSHYGRNGTDGDGTEYVFIRTKEDMAPRVEDTDELDSNGNSYEDGEYLPSVYYPNDDRSEIERNAIGDSEHPDDNPDQRGECTDDPKGVTETWPYEWVLKRTMAAPTAAGVRIWEPWSGMMSLWAKWSDDGESAVTYSIKADVTEIVVPSDATTAQATITAHIYSRTGAGAETLTQMYTAMVYRAGTTRTRITNGRFHTYSEIEVSYNADPQATDYRVFDAVEIFAWETSAEYNDAANRYAKYAAKLVIPLLKQGNTGPQGQAGTTYRCRWQLSGNEVQTLAAAYTGAVKNILVQDQTLTATLMKRTGSGAEAAATATGTATVAFGGLEFSSAITDAQMRKSVALTGSTRSAFDSNNTLKVTATFAIAGGETLTYTLDKVLDGQSITGATGAIPIPYGQFNPDSTYVRTADIAPYVLDPADGRYYLLTAATYHSSVAPSADAAGSNHSWVQLTQFDMVLAKMVIAEMGTIGAWVFWGDYMFSGQGQGDLGAPTEAGGTFVPNLLFDARTGSIKSRTGFFGGFARRMPTVVYAQNIETTLPGSKNIFANIGEIYWDAAALEFKMRAVPPTPTTLFPIVDMAQVGSKIYFCDNVAMGTTLEGFGDIIDTWQEEHNAEGDATRANVQVHLPFFYPYDNDSFEHTITLLTGDENRWERMKLDAESYAGSRIELCNYSSEDVLIRGLFYQDSLHTNDISPWSAVSIPPRSELTAVCRRVQDAATRPAPGAAYNANTSAWVYWEIETYVTQCPRPSADTWNYIIYGTEQA